MNGHNLTGGAIDGVAMRDYIERAMRLLDERDILNADLKVVYEEAKEAGFVTKHLRQIVREQRMDSEVLSRHLAILEAYRSALGDFAATPLGKANEPTRRRSRRSADADAD
jgi:uncharacterized protein (UPF0335 family)